MHNIELGYIAKVIAEKIASLTQEDIPITRIIKKIQNGEDLNDLSHYRLEIDLNVFLIKICEMRSQSFGRWVEYFTKARINKPYLDTLGLFFETHTNYENHCLKNIILKQKVAKKFANFPSFYKYLIQAIDNNDFELHF